MAKSLGELYVRLSARTAGFAESLGKAADAGAKRVAEAADAIEGKAAKMAAALGDITDGFLAVGGVAAVAFAGAANYSKPMADELERLKNTTGLLAVEVGTALLPVLRDTISLTQRVVTAWRSLDDGTKANIVSVVRWAAVLGPALFGLTRGIIIAKGFAEAFVVLGPAIGGAIKALTLFGSAAIGAGAATATAAAGAEAASAGFLASAGAMASGFLAALAPIAAVALAVGALVLLAGSLYKAWNDSSTGLADTVSAMATAMRQTASNVLQFFADMWTGLGQFIIRSASLVLDAVTGQARLLSSAVAPIAEAVGMTGAAGKLREIQGMTGAKLLSPVVDAFKSGADYLAAKAADVGKSVGDGVVFGFKYAADGAEDMLSAAWAKAKGLLPTMPDFSGKGVGVATSLADQDKAAKFAQDMADLQRDEQQANRDEYVAAMRAEAASAADNFRALAEEAGRFAKEAADKMQSARDGIANMVLSRSGSAAGLYNSASMGMAAGGPMGAVATVGIDLLTQSEGFKEVIEVANGVIKTVADLLGSLVKPLGPLVAALGTVIVPIVAALTPVFEVVGKALEPLVPPLMLLGQLLGALAPVFLTLNLGFQALKLGVELIEPVMKALFDVLQFVGVVILTVVKALMDAWNAISRAINSFIAKTQEVYTKAFGPLLGEKGKQIIGEVYGGLKLGELDTAGIQGQIDALKNATFEGSLDAAGQAAKDFANATNDATDAMLNVPAMWKIAFRRGEAEDAQSGPGGSAAKPGTVTNWQGPTDADLDFAAAHTARQMQGNVSNGDGTWTRPDGATVGANVNYEFNIYANNPAEAMEAAEKFVNKKGAERSTSGVGGNAI